MRMSVAGTVLAVVTTVLVSPAPAVASADEGLWQRLDTVGPAPSERSSPVAAGIGYGVYVFGGARDDFATGKATFHNDLHRLDVRSRT